MEGERGVRIWEAVKLGNEGVFAGLMDSACPGDFDFEAEYYVPELGHKCVLTALMVASCAGKINLVAMMLDMGVNVNQQSAKDGSTALMWAALVGHRDVVQLLLKRKADVNLQGELRSTALIWAAMGGSLEVVRLLLEWNADLNAENMVGVSALNIAAERGHLEVVKLLLEWKADVNALSKFRWTALMMAAKDGHLEVVRLLLLVWKADVNLQNREGRTALMMAAEAGHVEIVRLLLKCNADLSVQNKENGRTALIMAARNGHLEIVRLLLEGKADVKVQGGEGRTALMMAAGEGHLEVVRLLLKWKPNVNLQDVDGRTALMMAAQRGHLEVVRLLLKGKADVNLHDKEGNTAADYAKTSEISGLITAPGGRRTKGIRAVWDYFFVGKRTVSRPQKASTIESTIPQPPTLKPSTSDIAAGTTETVILSNATRHGEASTAIWSDPATGDEVAIHLAVDIMQNRTGGTIRLLCSGIGDLGIVALCWALQKNLMVTLKFEGIRYETILAHTLLGSLGSRASFPPSERPPVAELKDWRAYLVNQLVDGKQEMLRQFLDHFLSKPDPTIDHTFATVIAAWLGDTAMALKCLEMFPEQASEVLDECSLSDSPFRDAVRLDSRNVSSAGGAAGPMSAVHAVKVAAQAICGVTAISVVHVHHIRESWSEMGSICGALKMCFSGQPKSIGATDPSDAMSCLLGHVQVDNTKAQVCVELHEYDGGSESLSALQCAQLADPHSIYLINVPLWDIRPGTPRSLPEIVQSYRASLKFINSLAPSTVAKGRCVTLLNFKQSTLWVEDAQPVLDQLRQTIDDFAEGETGRLASSAILAADVGDLDTVYATLVPLLKQEVIALVGDCVTDSPALQAVLRDMAVPGQWPLMCTDNQFGGFVEGAVKEYLHQYTIDPIADKQLMRTVVTTTKRILEARSDVICLPSQDSSSIASLHVPARLLLQLESALRKSTTDKNCVLSFKDMKEITTDILSKSVRGTYCSKEEVIQLYTRAGICIPARPDSVKSVEDTNAVNRWARVRKLYWFPALDDSFISPIADQKQGGEDFVLKRQFAVNDVTKVQFPRCYSGALCAAMLKLHRNMHLVRASSDVVELCVRDDAPLWFRWEFSADRGSFTVSITCEGSNDHFAFKAMHNFKRLISNDGWMGNVPITEYALTNLGTMPIAALEESLGGSGSHNDQYISAYFGRQKYSSRYRLLINSILDVFKCQAAERRHSQGQSEPRFNTVKTVESPCQRAIDLLTQVSTSLWVVLIVAIFESMVSKATAEQIDSSDKVDMGSFLGSEALHIMKWIASCFSMLSIPNLTAHPNAHAVQSTANTTNHVPINELTPPEKGWLAADWRLYAAVACTVALGLFGMLQMLKYAVQSNAEIEGRRTRASIRNSRLGLRDVPLLVCRSDKQIDDAERHRVWEQLDQLVERVYTLHFCCPVCGVNALSGPTRLGYELRECRPALRKASNVLKWLLGVAKQVLPMIISKGDKPIRRMIKHWPTAQVHDALKGLEFLKDDYRTQNTSPYENGEAFVVTNAHIDAVKRLLALLDDPWDAKTKPAPRYTCLHAETHKETGELTWVCLECCATYLKQGDVCLRYKLTYC